MAQIIVDTDYYSLEEVAEEIILRQQTTGMPWKLAITSVLESYVAPTKQTVEEIRYEQPAAPVKRKRGRPRKNPNPTHADISSATGTEG